MAKVWGWQVSTLGFPVYVADGIRWAWNQLFDTVPYQIVETDYDNYAVVYGCEDQFLWIFHYRYATLLSRRTYLEGEYSLKVKRLLVNRFDYPFFNDWTRPGDPC